jgi:hypothetical protein
MASDGDSWKELRNTFDSALADKARIEAQDSVRRRIFLNRVMTSHSS